MEEDRKSGVVGDLYFTMEEDQSSLQWGKTRLPNLCRAIFVELEVVSFIRWETVTTEASPTTESASAIPASSESRDRPNPKHNPVRTVKPNQGKADNTRKPHRKPCFYESLKPMQPRNSLNFRKMTDMPTSDSLDIMPKKLPFWDPKNTFQLDDFSIGTVYT
ncbi:hypothetical protein LXL04_003589 [Taraxacum kok-saghyz]